MGGERRFAEWMRPLWPIAVLTLLCVAFFWDLLWLPSDQLAAGGDLAGMFVPWLRFASSSVEQGQLPLWNPYLFSGLPFVANPQPALFYPPHWLALLLRVTTVLNWLIVLHLWLAGVGTYHWLRFEGASHAGALVGGVVFLFSGYFSVRVLAGHLGVITTQAWLPYLLWGLGRAVKRHSWRLAFAGGIPVGLSVLAGHTASFILVALGLAAYAVFLAWERWAKERTLGAAVLPLGQAAVMLVAGLALASVQLLPTVELVLNSTREAAPSYSFASSYSWPPGYLITLLVPNFFGEPVRTEYWGARLYQELIFYVGVLPLLLALLGMRLRHRLVPFLGVLGLGGLLVAFGSYGSAHRLLYRFVPLIGMMRVPARAGVFFVLTTAAMAGLMASALWGSDCEERKRLLQGLTWRRVAVVIGGATALAVAGFSAYAIAAQDNAGATRLWHQANAVAHFAFLLLLAAALLTAWRGAARSRHRYLALAFGLVLLDLWGFGGPAIQPTEVAPSTYWSVVAKVVPDPEQVRILPWELGYFEQNEGMDFGLRSVVGYDPLVLRRYDEFVRSWPDPRARTYDLLNVGYLATYGLRDFPEDGWPPSPQLVHQQWTVYVYERPAALPRAWVATESEVLDGPTILGRIREPSFDPLRTALVEEEVECDFALGADLSENAAEIVRYEANEIEVEVSGSGGLLVLSEVYYPGWRATIDGSASQLLRTDYVLRGLCVPAGEHSVELVYDPPLLKVGLAVTGVTAALLVAVGASWALPAVRRRGQERV